MSSRNILSNNIAAPAGYPVVQGAPQASYLQPRASTLTTIPQHTTLVRATSPIIQSTAPIQHDARISQATRQPVFNPRSTTTTIPRISVVAPTVVNQVTNVQQVRPSTTAYLGQGRLSEIRDHGTKFIEERYVGERVVNITENRLEERVIQTAVPQLNRIVKQVETFEDEPIIQEKIVEKQVEIIVEKKIPVEKYVDVPYDVIVERPIEKIIEKEIEIEKILEKEIEKIVEVPIERIVEVPYERVVEVPVEYETRVEVPYEKVVERRVEEVHDNIIYHDNFVTCNVNELGTYPNAQILPTEVVVEEVQKVVERPVYIDNIIERVVDIPIEKIIEVPVERLVEKPVEQIVEKAVYIDNIIEREVQIPVEKIVEKPVERVIEKPVYYENIIEKPVPIEVVREEVVEVPVEHIVERPVYVDNIIEKAVEVIVENPVPVETIIEIPVANVVDLHVNVDEAVPQTTEIISEVPIPVETIRKLPIEYIVRAQKPVPVESVLEVKIPKPNKQIHEKIITRPVEWERIVERAVPVEKIVEVEVERVTENPVYVEKVVEKMVTFDKVIEQKYDVIVENVIEIPVEKEIQVPVKTFSQQPNEIRNYFEKDVNVISTKIEPVEGGTTEINVQVDDPELVARTQDNLAQITAIKAQNQQLTVEVNQAKAQGGNPNQLNQLITANAHLKAELAEIESRINIIDKDKDRITSSLNTKTIQQINYTVPDPRLGQLTGEIKQALAENKALVGQAIAEGEKNRQNGELSLNQSSGFSVQINPVANQVVSIVPSSQLLTTSIPAAATTTTQYVTHRTIQQPAQVLSTIQEAPITRITSQAPVTRVLQQPATRVIQQPLNTTTIVQAAPSAATQVHSPTQNLLARISNTTGFISPNSTAAHKRLPSNLTTNTLVPRLVNLGAVAQTNIIPKEDAVSSIHRKDDRGAQ